MQFLPVEQGCGGRLSMLAPFGGPIEDFPQATLVHLAE